MRKGQCCSKETKKKLSVIQKKLYANGYINPNKGKKRSLQAIKKFSKTMKHIYANGYVHPMTGKHRSKNTKLKQSQTMKKNYATGKITNHLKNKTYEEVYGFKKAKLLKLERMHAKLGTHQSKQTRIKNSIAHKGKKYSKSLYPNFGWRGKIPYNKGKTYAEIYGVVKAKRIIKCLSTAHMGQKVKHTEQTRSKISNTRKIRIKQGLINPFKGHNIKPNKPEQRFIKLCQKYNLPYRYVGDGKFWIENINPDFININGEKVCVEIFGNYWHNYPNGTEKDKEKEKILEKYGWKRIVIWEKEIYNEQQVINKIKNKTGEI